MKQESEKYYREILKRELLPAFGCTEPIAIALAGAKLREILGQMPDHIVANCSGNVVKNVKGVTVPNSGERKGIETAAILGALSGNPAADLEVLENVKLDDLPLLQKLLEQRVCEVKVLESSSNLHIILEGYSGNESASIEIKDRHSNITSIYKNGKLLIRSEETEEKNSCEEYSAMTLEGVFDYARLYDTSTTSKLFEKEIIYNTSISEEGLNHPYGASTGRMLFKLYPEDDIAIRAQAKAAAGSDARMNGCSMPVVINSGSGNQGITVTVPVVEYARELNSTKEDLYRALTISNLVSIYVKSKIGRLSAFCGAVSAASGTAAAIVFLKKGSDKNMEDAIVNTLAIASGIVCDGAKSSCAAKIMLALQAATVGGEMALNGKRYGNGEGIVMNSTEETIEKVGQLARNGMKETDAELLRIMTEAR